ncbi:nucleotidyltransferase family protein [candidate division TA06 bacterium]|nr:nucleotidyltransferase family protein [candidate division TA06 bacterium]
MKEMGIPGIILAAGPGTRFSLPMYKLLMPFRGKTILNGVVKTALVSELESVWVVIGHEKEMIWKALYSLPPSKRLHIIENPDYLKGRASSLRCGFEAVPKPVEHAMFLLGDQPLVTVELINQLIQAVEENPDKPLFFPLKGHRLGSAATKMISGEKGNPIVYSQLLFDELIGIEGDKSGFKVVEKYFDEAHQLVLKDSTSQLNVNSYEDYLELLKHEA